MTSQRNLPAAGLRGIDLGIITAGASTSAILADLGADVVKIESASYLDPFRLWDIAKTDGRWWDASPLYHFTNRNKRGVSIDLKSAAGRELILALVRQADVVVENFRRGVLDKLGLGFAALHAANPRIVLASISSQGEDGPDCHAVSFGSTLDATSGLAWLSGYEGGPPTISGRDLNFPDQVVSIFAAGSILAALQHVAESGEGGHLDLPQRELTSFRIGQVVIISLRGGAERGRMGNKAGAALLQVVFQGQDGWVAVTIASRSEAETLIQELALGGNGDIAKHLSAWVAARSKAAAADALQRLGIPAAPVRGSADLGELSAADLGWAIVNGPDGVPAKGFPFQLQHAPLAVRSRAPALGEHTEAIRSDLLGPDRQELDALKAAGITRDVPAR